MAKRGNPSELNCLKVLREMVPDNLKVEYETDKLPYTIESTYLPDFPVKFKNKKGVKVYIEYKGNGRAFSRDVRRKMIAIKEQYPQHRFCIVFHSDGILEYRKRKDGTYPRQSEWAKKYGFDFCIGASNIPKEWFE